MRGRGIVVVGAQFGDEGKGKLVDSLAETADVVVRFQGGNNAGHTIVAEGRTFKLHLLPTGVVRSRRSLISAGVVVDPRVLAAEIEELSHAGIFVNERLLGIDLRSHVILPWHAAQEAASGQGQSIGTTGRGIGPAYADATARTGLRFADLIDASRLQVRLAEIAAGKEKLLAASEEQAAGAQGTVQAARGAVSLEKTFEEYSELGARLRAFACDVSHEVNDALRTGRRVLFEGAQGTFLDKSFGTYPFVTSSHPISGGACVGVGIGPSAIHEVHGVAKAYTTRVGSGPFPTELSDALGELLVEKGHEYGTTTGRRRRVGWLDACMLRRANDLNGLDCLHLTKLDILGGIRPLYVAVSYMLENGRKTKLSPSDTAELAAAKAEYIEMSGFDDLNPAEWLQIVEDGREAGLAALPAEALAYVKKVQELSGVRIASVSVGPEREKIIWAK